MSFISLVSLPSQHCAPLFGFKKTPNENQIRIRSRYDVINYEFI